MLLKSFNEKNDGEAMREHTILKLNTVLFVLLYSGVHACSWRARPFMHVHYTCNSPFRVYIAWYKHERGRRIQDSIQLCRPTKVESLHMRSKENKCQINKMTSCTLNFLGPVVWRQFSRNPWLNFNPGFLSFVQKRCPAQFSLFFLVHQIIKL